MNPFDFVNAVCYSKEDLFEDPQADKDYVPFIVNKALSYHIDSVFFANEINSRSHLSKKMQFDFLRYSLPKKKRYSKWAKKLASTQDLEAVCTYYKYSQAKAYEVMSLLTQQQIDQIKQQLSKGGM